MQTSKILVVLVAAASFVFGIANQSQGGEEAIAFGEPVNMGASINTPHGEGSPKISADGLELYFHSSRPGGSGGNDLWMVRRSSLDEPWGQAANLGQVVNSPADEGAPTISADGLELYFHDWGTHRADGVGNADIWMTRRETKDSPWQAPINLGHTVNSIENEATPEISADGLELYFESERPGGFGSDDIWVSRRASTDAPWGPPENLGPEINTAEWEHCPNLSADGLTLFFDVRIPGDLVVSRRASLSAPWQAPVILGNDASDHYASSVSGDGNTLYFSSKRPGGLGKGDIWRVPILSGVSN